jgi:hypothetical protein
MNQIDIQQLDKCIQMMFDGASLDDCKKLYPNLSNEVIANLELAIATMELGKFEISTEQMNKNRDALLEKARDYRENIADLSLRKTSWLAGLLNRIPKSQPIMQFAGRMVIVLVITATLVIFSRGLVITSAKSLPGDTLYPIKRAVEDIRVYLTANQSNKHAYEEDYNLERVGEVIRLLAINRVQKISFEGTVEEMTSSRWTVSGISVNIQPDTTMLAGLSNISNFTIGSVVEVEGITDGMGSVDAKEIHLRQYELEGKVEIIDSNTWQISGFKIPVSSGTKIENGIVVGDTVLVLINSEDDGLYAASIQIKGQPIQNPEIQPPLISTPIPNDEIITPQMETKEPEETINPDQPESAATQAPEEGYDNPAPTSEDSQISTPVPERTDEHEHEDGSSTPEYHQTPEPTDTHEGEP